MSTLERQAHWQNVYQTNGERAVSWFQETPDIEARRAMSALPPKADIG